MIISNSLHDVRFPEPIDYYIYDNIEDRLKMGFSEMVRECVRKGEPISNGIEDMLLRRIIKLDGLLNKIKNLFEDAKLIVIECEEFITIYDYYNLLLFEVTGDFVYTGKDKICNTIAIHDTSDIYEYSDFMEYATIGEKDEYVMCLRHIVETKG